jgi:hypothetical protein
MKNLKIGILLMTAVVMTGAVSCKKKGCTDSTALNYSDKAKKDDGSCSYPSSEVKDTTVNGVNYITISGTIDADMTFTSANSYILSGGVLVDNGATLTIEAGTTIYGADDNTIPFLAIQRGAKIMAIGTETNPIVFSTIKANPQAGDWGGLILNGKAPVNNGVDPMGEGNTGLYGGSDATDNSGVLKYVRVEYAGKQITADKELNGFSFYAVGNGTTLDHLQAYKNADDGFEFFGGTVNLTNSLSYGSGDDSFDFTYGWSGNGTNWLAIQSATEGDRGIEGDNNSSNNAAAPFSNPTLSNIKLVGRGSVASTSGMKLREGTKATITNIEIVDFSKGIDIEHDQTLNNVTAGSLTVSQATTTNCTTSISFKGNKDSQGNVVNPQMETDAANSGNAVVDNNGSVSTAWITGTWSRSL